jgi:flagellar secretion chaperone FliS
MNTNRTQIAYQEAAVRNANSIELVVMLYDILSRDLHGAIEAMESGNIELRTAKLKHGFLALQQLEGSLDLEQGGDFVSNLSRFYSMLRSQMMTAQIRKDPAVLRELIQLLFSVREAWTELNTRSTVSLEALSAQNLMPVTTEAEPERFQTASWKA